MSGYLTMGRRIVWEVIQLRPLADLASSHASSTWLFIITFEFGCRAALACLRYTGSDPGGYLGCAMIICRAMALGMSSKNIANENGLAKAAAIFPFDMTDILENPLPHFSQVNGLSAVSTLRDQLSVHHLNTSQEMRLSYMVNLRDRTCLVR